MKLHVEVNPKNAVHYVLKFKLMYRYTRITAADDVFCAMLEEFFQLQHEYVVMGDYNPLNRD